MEKAFDQYEVWFVTGAQLLYGGVFVFPVTYHYFAADAHTGTDMSEFAVTMGGLIQIHEVHIHGIPRNFLIELSV